MTLYGIPYQGSKTKIAPAIVQILPPGKRFVDLFGGGFAMSHCARLSGKWGGILYNELDPLLPELIPKALDGAFNYNRFKPPFVTREEFFQRRESDGYVKYIWSFGNAGKNYMFGKEVEPLKREAHDFVVFGKRTTRFHEIERFVTSTDIHVRRMQFCGACKRRRGRFDLQQLQQLERLQQLEHLERLQQLEQLERLIEIRHGSYDGYEYRNGDVVYCDPPYEGTADYGETFDSERFYAWLKSRPYQVWFSSYAGVNGFRLVWAKQLRSTLGSGNKAINFECLYTNR